MLRFMLERAARRAFGPLTTIERDGTWLDVIDGSGRPCVSFHGVDAEERALDFLRSMPRWDTRPWWKRAGESVLGLLWLPTMVGQIRRYLRGQS